MPQLSSRPLTASDDALYVRRAADLAVRAALKEGDNVLLGAVRGAGATSLLNHLEAEVSDAVLMNAERAASASDVIASLVSQLRLRQNPADAAGPSPQAGSSSGAADSAPPRRDPRARGPTPDSAAGWTDRSEGLIRSLRTLAGRPYSLPLNWVVLAHYERLAEYVTPPADVFFDAIVRLDEFDASGALEVLQRRDVLPLPDDVAQSIVRHFDGTPRHLIRLARGALGSDAGEVAHRAEQLAETTSSLSRGARQLLADMQGRGPIPATDPSLLRRLGVTDRQMRRKLVELEAAGLPNSGTVQARVKDALRQPTV